MNINTKRVLGYTRWESSCLCWHSCCRRRHGRRRGRRLSSAAEDQERRFLHADSEKVKDSQRQRPAAPAHTQVLHQRALLQPQGGGNKRAHVLYDHSVPGAGKPAGVEGLVLPVAPHCKSHDEVIGPPLQTQLVCVGFSRFQLEGFPYSFLFKTFKVFQESLKLEWKVWVCSSTVCPLSCRCVDVFFLFPPDICVHSSVRLSH